MLINSVIIIIALSCWVSEYLNGSEMFNNKYLHTYMYNKLFTYIYSYSNWIIHKVSPDQILKYRF